VVEERPSGFEVLRALTAGDARLVVLGTRLEDLTLSEVVRRIRASDDLREVSVLALIPAGESPSTDGEVASAGANAVLRRPVDRSQLEEWIAKLLTVARRVEVRIPIDGQVVGSPRDAAAGHFYGLARNISAHGLLLACPIRLSLKADLELNLRLADVPAPFKALGRVVREAGDVHWPYLGYGIEFLYVPEGSLGVIDSVVRSGAARFGPTTEGGIHSTLRRGPWVYEVLQPTPCVDGWQVEIRRAVQEGWRPGKGGPFFVVAAPTPTAALLRAREFLGRQA
jgi:CheY-like chemotaxis protein